MPTSASTPARHWLIAQALLGLLTIGLPHTVAAQTAAQPTPAQAGVRTARLDNVWLQPERSAPAQVLARNESRLAAEVGGTLLRWTVDVGASVRPGELLAQIDPQDHELARQRAVAARDAARARLALGQSQLKRSRELRDQGFISPDALAQRETEVALQQAELASAEAQWRSAQRQVEKTALRAPFAGSVVQRLAQQGESVAPGTVLYVLAQQGASELSASIAPTDAAGLRQSPAPTFEPQGSTQAWPLKLLRIAPTVQASSRSQTARLAFASPDAPPPGTPGLLRWRDATPHLPATLVVKRQQTLGVFVKQDGKARFVPLPGAEEGRAAPVHLPASTALVVQGQATLQDGQPLS